MCKHLCTVMFSPQNKSVNLIIIYKYMIIFFIMTEIIVISQGQEI